MSDDRLLIEIQVDTSPAVRSLREVSRAIARTGQAMERARAQRLYGIPVTESDLVDEGTVLQTPDRIVIGARRRTIYGLDVLRYLLSPAYRRRLDFRLEDLQHMNAPIPRFQRGGLVA